MALMALYCTETAWWCRETASEAAETVQGWCACLLGNNKKLNLSNHVRVVIVRKYCYSLSGHREFSSPRLWRLQCSCYLYLWLWFIRTRAHTHTYYIFITSFYSMVLWRSRGLFVNRWRSLIFLFISICTIYFAYCVIHSVKMVRLLHPYCWIGLDYLK